MIVVYPINCLFCVTSPILLTFYFTFTDIRVCGVCSAGLLRDMGYGLQLRRVPRVVILCGGMEVLIAVYSKSSMPYVVLSDKLETFK